MSRSLSNRTFILLAVLPLAGCGRNDIQAYRVPKEQPPALQPEPAAAGNAAQFKWTTPTGWTEMPAGEFRVASFKITGPDNQQADVSVIPLPGEAGGDFSNVNRWRNQVGQPPLTEAEWQKLGEALTIAGQPALLYDQTGDTTRILAVIQHRAGTAWFFKMTGDQQLVAQQKPAFVEFLQSFQFTGGETPPTPVATTGSPQWTVPADWQPGPAGQFLVAKFVVTGAGSAQAVVNISSSAGNGGGLAANVNRWRRQLGLGAASDDDIAKAAQTTGPATLVELKGASAALVGVIVTRPDQTWFYKLMGDPAVVVAQKDAFLKFVQGVKY